MPSGPFVPAYSALAHHTGRLAQRAEAVLSFAKVVDRAEQWNDVDGFVREIESTCVPGSCIDSSCVPLVHLRDMVRDEISVHHVVTPLDEPVGVATWTASDVSDRRRRGRQGPGR